jgi:hypothetical protein
VVSSAQDISALIEELCYYKVVAGARKTPRDPIQIRIAYQRNSTNLSASTYQAGIIFFAHGFFDTRIVNVRTIRVIVI